MSLIRFQQVITKQPITASVSFKKVYKQYQSINAVDSIT
jgi:hypothetical protein